MPQALSTDILIVGGGIAGLWLNARLRRAGYATVLVESASLGGGQSVKSQGIIHGGAKYALHGALTGASEAIADMPRRWRACLGSNGELDLRGVRLLSEAHYLWSPGGLAGSLTSFFASKAVRSRVEQAKGEDLPPALRDKGFKGKAYRLTEIVFDVPDLIRRLAELAGDSLLAGERIEPLREGRELAGLCVDGREIRAQRVVLSAGAGNEALLRELGLEQPAMQRRPLHMVMVKAATLETAVRPLPGGRAEATNHRDHPSDPRRPVGLVPRRRHRRSRWRGPRRSRADRRSTPRTGKAAALDRPRPGAVGHLAGGSRRAGTVQPVAPGQRLPRRTGTPAGRLADQAGAGP
ncbi:FAD-dependent oxidoreductase [Pseudomonas aeruginosa]